MQIRPAQPSDLQLIIDVDGTIESTRYLHLNRTGEGFACSWQLEDRPLRQKLIESNPMPDDALFALKQITTGADEGLALIAEHDGTPIALVVAQLDPSARTLRVLDLRVDSDFRRQGIGLALIFRCIQDARDRQLRAVTARTFTNNHPAVQFLLKAGFELAGLDTQLRSNHDLVKEAVALFWYASLD